MLPDFLDPGGLVVPTTALRLPRSREVVQAMQSRDDRYAALVECRRSEGVEIVVVDLEPERPQIRSADIRRSERVALVFSEGDRSCPEVLSLRTDFPEVLHLHQWPTEYPRRFCLYSRSWAEIRVTWTGASFLEDVRSWLSRTASGTLHEADQPLEPLLLGANLWLVIPSEISDATPCLVYLAGGPNGRVLLGHSLGPASHNQPAPHVLLRIQTPPRMHGSSPRAPITLQDVFELISTDDFDLLAEFRRRLADGSRALEPHLASQMLILVEMPKTRVPNGPVVAVDRKAFLTAKTTSEVGVGVGVWRMSGRERSLLLPVEESLKGKDVEILIANVTDWLTPDLAAIYNGSDRANPVKVVAVGVGSLGSQVCLNLARAGFGNWTIVDDDFVLPHNFARHALAGPHVGQSKAKSVAAMMNSLFTKPIAKAIHADVLDAKEAEQGIVAACSAAELMIDLAASIPVARSLVRRTGDARRMSVFLSPSGGDLVLLCEDQHRTITLDCLEMTYYAAVSGDERLRDHLRPAAGSKRYGLSCRDIASVLPQSRVAMFAGLASEAIQDAVGRAEATVRVWRSDAVTHAITPIDVPAERWHRNAVGHWTVHVAHSVLTQTAAWRRERLENETGGILLGGVDHEHRGIYIGRALPSPPDSKERRAIYVRGKVGTREAVEQVVERTLGHVIYLGEWHSHPTGHSTLPSQLDIGVLATVAEWVGGAGQPGLIMIAGDRGCGRVILGEFDPNQPPGEICPE